MQLIIQHKGAIAMIFLLGCFFGVGALHADAHTTGAYLEKVTDQYLIDIGYSPQVLMSGVSSQFDFNLLSADQQEVGVFTDVQVRISKDQSTVFATGITHASVGLTSLIYTFPEDGTYELSVRYQNNGENVADATFSLMVENGSGGGQGSPWIPISAGLVGLLIGFALSMMFRRNS